MVASLALLAMVGGGRAAAAQDCASGAVFTGPISITRGGTYTGNWRSQDPSIPAVGIFTTQPVTIINARVVGPGDLITIGSRSNVTIQQSCFVGTNPNIAGQAKGSAIHAYQTASVLVEHCDFESVGYYGVFVQQYLGDATPGNSFRIRYNRFHNVDARASNGAGGYLTTQTSQESHAIILTNVNGVPGIEIAWNQIINEPYQSGVGDSINIFDSSGTSASPMQIHDNYVQGGWDSDPANGDGFAYFGSAFTTDGLFQTDPRLTTAFLKVHDNQAVGFGNLGMSISLGHDIEMSANRVVSSGQLANGTSSATSYAIGIQHLNYRNTPPGVFGNNSIHDNVSGVRKQRNGSWERLDYYYAVPPAVVANNASWIPATSSAPTPTDEANEFALWSGKLSAHGITVGVAPRTGVPDAPGSLTASASGSTVSLAWTPPAGGPALTTYYVEAGSIPGAADLANLPTGSTATTFSASGVGAGIYYVRVRAANAIGAGPPSPEVTLVVGSSCTAPPAPPAGLTSAVVGSTVTLTWSPSPGATAYVIEAGSTTGSSNLAVVETGSAPVFVAPGVAAGIYFVRLRARNACATSGPSNEAVVRVQ